MTKLPPDLPDQFGTDDDPYHDTQDGRWLGWLFLALPFFVASLIYAAWRIIQ